ncbi:MAG: polysaccharide biosynthesis protein [Clostridiales bacterium]|nr:polysaccharide biosynthesis protein [Clostridiales bacterium]
MLAICSLIAKLLGAFFRIPLTNILGAQGMGVYQMVFPVYSIVLMLSSGGLPVAISKVVANKSAQGDVDGAQKVLKVSLLLMSIVGILGSAVIVMLHRLIPQWQGNSQASLAYLGISPSILFVCIMSVFKGYFQGRQNMLPSSIMQIAEQLVKLLVGITLSLYFMQWGIAYAALGAILGITVSELVAMIVLICFYVFNTKGKKSNINYNLAHNTTEVAVDWNLTDYTELDTNLYKTQSTHNSTIDILKTVYKVAIPVTLGALILPLTQVVDSVIIINFLISNGISKHAATSQYGILNGPVSSLLNLPILVTLAISVALLPKIAKNFVQGHDVQTIVNSNMKYSLMISVPCFAGFIIYCKDIMQLMYGKGLDATELEQSVLMLQLLASIIIYSSIMQICTATLQGLDQAHKPAYILGIGAIFKVVFTVVLMHILGIYGVCIATVIFYIVACMLNILACSKSISIKYSGIQGIKIILITCASFGIGHLVRSILPNNISHMLAIVTCGLLSILIYGILCILTRLVPIRKSNTTTI